MNFICMSLKSKIISGSGQESTVTILFILLLLKNDKSIAAVKFPEGKLFSN